MVSSASARVRSPGDSLVCTIAVVALAVQPAASRFDGALPMKLESIHDSKFATFDWKLPAGGAFEGSGAGSGFGGGGGGGASLSDAEARKGFPAARLISFSSVMKPGCSKRRRYVPGAMLGKVTNPDGSVVASRSTGP